MDEKTNKLSNDWVRCQSKSRPDRYYLFNKKTGETNWCAGNEGNNHLKTVTAKDVTKTPAQNRLKRLQNQLEKKRVKEAAAERTKSERVPKKQEQKGSSKGNPSPKKESDTKREKSSRKESHASKETETVVSPSSSNTSSVQERLIIGRKKSAEKPTSEKSKPKESIPPERNKSSNVPAVQAPVKVKKIQSVPQTPLKAQLTAKGASVQYDENKNQRQSEEKVGILSKIKGFCSNLLNGASKGRRKSTEGEKLSATSKPLFKRKKNKDLLRGITCDIGREAVKSPSLVSARSPDKTPKVIPPISVPKESANGRLARLRKSLKEQQVRQPSSVPTPLAIDSIPPLNDVECEPMDWQPIAEDVITNSPSISSGTSADLSTVSEHNDTVSENISRLVAAKRQSKDWKKDHFHFVIDTNVFIEHPTFVEDLTSMRLCDTMGSVIYIPYCVLQELDKLKIRSLSESIKLRTRRAIKLLNKAFETKNPQFQAQSAADDSVHLIKVTSPDDSILNCCLQVKQHVDNLLLLTEDVNLQSKAMCNDILVSTKSDLISLH